MNLNLDCTTEPSPCQEAYSEISKLYAKRSVYYVKANAAQKGKGRDAWIDLADGVDAQIETVLRDKFGFKANEIIDFFDMTHVGFEPDDSVDKIIHLRDEVDHRNTMNALLFGGGH